VIDLIVQKSKVQKGITIKEVIDGKTEEVKEEWVKM